MNESLSGEVFEQYIKQAQEGHPKTLNNFLQVLYKKGKHSLVKLTQSEVEAEEYFSMAVAKFWEKFVDAKEPLPESNIAGYIYIMAKYLYLDRQRTNSKLKIVSPVNTLLDDGQHLAEAQKSTMEFQEEAKQEQWRQTALKKAMTQLSENCQRLFSVILEEGLTKSKDLFRRLELSDARAVTVLRYECTKRLKVLAAMELEILSTGQNT